MCQTTFFKAKSDVVSNCKFKFSVNYVMIVSCFGRVRRIDRRLDVRNVLVLEAAHHVEDAVDRRNVREKRVAETGAVGRALDQAGNVGHLEHGRHARLGRVLFAQKLEALVGHHRLALARIDCAERVVGRVHRLLAQQIEERALQVHVCASK